MRLCANVLSTRWPALWSRDPYELRLDLTSGKLRQVLELAASKAGWGRTTPWGLGHAALPAGLPGMQLLWRRWQKFL